MKKAYEEPTLEMRETLDSVTATNFISPIFAAPPSDPPQNGDDDDDDDRRGRDDDHRGRGR